MEHNRLFYIRQIGDDGKKYVGVTSNSSQINSHLTVEPKKANDYDGKQVWYFDDNNQLVNVFTGHLIGYDNSDPGLPNVTVLMQKPNERSPEFQWTYDTNTKRIYNKVKGQDAEWWPHYENDRAYIVVKKGAHQDPNWDKFEIIYKNK
ncbi:hypothetical protein RMATCC62417_04282 [Rhizopus microsporus]|nr:hypothetical protein RMATCC62417_04282 [Rhizopus microsporus]